MGLLVAQTHPSVPAFPETTIGSACTSSFSRIARRSLTLRPAHSRGHQNRDRLSEGFRHFVTSMPAPVASGWSGRRAGLAPAGNAPPCHGARGNRTFAPDFFASLGIVPATPALRVRMFDSATPARGPVSQNHRWNHAGGPLTHSCANSRARRDCAAQGGLTERRASYGVTQSDRALHNPTTSVPSHAQGATLFVLLQPVSPHPEVHTMIYGSVVGHVRGTKHRQFPLEDESEGGTTAVLPIHRTTLADRNSQKAQGSR